MSEGRAEQQQNMTWQNPGGDEIKSILTGSKTIAVVGLSAKEDRASHRVARYLIEHGFDVIPVNPRETTILGRKSYPDLSSIDKPIDIVDIFRKGDATPPIVKEAVEVGAGNIWLQEGVISDESFQIATEAKIPIVMDRCILKEHANLGS